jgi:cbb3-type cytochrome oxidase subunit 3
MKEIEETPQGIKYNGKTYTDLDETQKDLDDKKISPEEHMQLDHAVLHWEDKLREDAKEKSKEPGKQLGIITDKADNCLKDDKDNPHQKLKDKIRELWDILSIVFTIFFFAGIFYFLPKHMEKIKAEKEAKAALIKTDSIDTASIVEAARFQNYIAKAKSMMGKASAQIKGIDKYTTISNNDEFSIAINQPEKWFFINMNDTSRSDLGYYVMWFEKSPIGEKHALSKINELCSINGITFNKPDFDYTLIKGWDIKGYCLSFSSDSKVSWFIEGIPFSFSSNSNIYSIMLSYSDFNKTESK